MLNLGRISDKLNLKKLIRNNSAKNKTKRKQIQFYHGEQDQIDLISLVQRSCLSDGLPLPIKLRFTRGLILHC